jgi:hypothetical protein
MALGTRTRRHAVRLALVAAGLLTAVQLAAGPAAVSGMITITAVAVIAYSAGRRQGAAQPRVPAHGQPSPAGTGSTGTRRGPARPGASAAGQASGSASRGRASRSRGAVVVRDLVRLLFAR